LRVTMDSRVGRIFESTLKQRRARIPRSRSSKGRRRRLQAVTERRWGSCWARIRNWHARSSR